ncbi:MULTISPECIES: helix-turn-helix domain-containing protein [Sphingobacterium]|uniref:Helix-turn-helix domain-containing protein n=1 Tax=Sphingobacterium populi TaxID=1812824 RepID=A0ABW5UDC0_9SPHI|nr:helix-turn-helix domain-containing protein [Sphingobacterium sp. CFCC 11742]
MQNNRVYRIPTSEIKDITDLVSNQQTSLLPATSSILTNDSFTVEYLQDGKSSITEDPEKYVLCMVVQGSALIDGADLWLDISSGSLLCSSGGLYLKEWTDDFSCFVIHIKKDFLEEVLAFVPSIQDTIDSKFDQPFVFFVAENVQKPIIRLFADIYEEFYSGKFLRTSMLKVLLVELVLKVVRATQLTPAEVEVEHTTSRKELLVKDFQQRVDKHFMTVRRVNQYASMLFVSAKYLSESVKEVLGVTALQIIHDRLSKEAEYWLSQTTLSVKEIAFKLNFDNSSHFSRFFKRFAGINPGQFQRRVQVAALR